MQLSSDDHSGDGTAIRYRADLCAWLLTAF